ncbi:MAG TPA: winged helix-turn-helix domain-containing protein [Candidatus Acidoferrales bacterium]
MSDDTTRTGQSESEAETGRELAPAGSQTASNSYRFENFEIDCARLELRRHGLKIHLKGRPFTLLAVLVESEGQIVTREQLRARLWSPDTHVDFDANLTTAFCTLRRALGDSSKESRFIETIPGQGYRFIEPVVRLKIRTPAMQTSADAASVLSINRVPANSESHDSNDLRRKILVAACCAAALVAVIAGFGYRHVLSVRAASTQPVRLAVLPFTEIAAGSEAELIADGLHDAIITGLANRYTSQFAVICRTTSMRYKHTDETVQQIARELSVDYIVEGSVQTEHDRTHIAVRLVRAEDQSQLWADSYDRPFQDVISVESEVADQIGAALSLRGVIPATVGTRAISPVTPCKPTAAAIPSAFFPLSSV